MGELQASCEFSVEIHKFYNVDLFQRGFYQIRVQLKLNPKLQSKIEVNLPRNSSKGIATLNGAAVSKTFQILYRNEEVAIDDQVLFKVHLIVDSSKIEESIQKADFQLLVELWFTEQTFGPDHHNSIHCISSQLLNLHLCPQKGLHHHIPVLFDYFHLSAVTATIHGCLLALHQPYINCGRSSRKPAVPWIGSSGPTSASTFGLVSCTGSSGSPKLSNKFPLPPDSNQPALALKSSPSMAQMNNTRCLHQQICSMLLASYESLQTKLLEYLKLLPPWQQIHIATTDCASKLEKLSEIVKGVEVEDEFLAIVHSDIAQLCAENIILWQQFLEAFTFRDRIRQHLAREHHLHRIKRFAEAYFLVEHPRDAIMACADNTYQSYELVAEHLRKSRYFQLLPPLAVECPEMDGSPETLPIIFEDQYQDTTSKRKMSREDLGAPLVFQVNMDDIHVQMKKSSIDQMEDAGDGKSSGGLVNGCHYDGATPKPGDRINRCSPPQKPHLLSGSKSASSISSTMVGSLESPDTSVFTALNSSQSSGSLATKTSAVKCSLRDSGLSTSESAHSELSTSFKSYKLHQNWRRASADSLRLVSYMPPLPHQLRNKHNPSQLGRKTENQQKSYRNDGLMKEDGKKAVGAKGSKRSLRDQYVVDSSLLPKSITVITDRGNGRRTIHRLCPDCASHGVERASLLRVNKSCEKIHDAVHENSQKTTQAGERKFQNLSCNTESLRCNVNKGKASEMDSVSGHHICGDVRLAVGKNSLYGKLRNSLRIDLKSVGSFCTKTLTLAAPRALIKNKLKRGGGIQTEILVGNKLHVCKLHRNKSDTNMVGQCSRGNENGDWQDTVILMDYKKLEQSTSVPQALGQLGSGGKTVWLSCCGSQGNGDDETNMYVCMKHSQSSWSMPSILTGSDGQVVYLVSESMPDLTNGTATLVGEELEEVANECLRHSQKEANPCCQAWGETQESNPASQVLMEEFSSRRLLEEQPLVQQKRVTSSAPIPLKTLPLNTMSRKFSSSSSLSRRSESSSPTSEHSGLISSVNTSSEVSLTETDDISVLEALPEEDNRMNEMKEEKGETRTSTQIGNEQHIYEEIHLPPEEFRDPETAGSRIRKTFPYSVPYTSPSSKRSKARPSESMGWTERTIPENKSCSQCLKDIGKSPRKSKDLGMKSEPSSLERKRLRSSASNSSDGTLSGGPPERRHMRAHHKHSAERMNRLSENYLSKKCTILEMFQDPEEQADDDDDYVDDTLTGGCNDSEMSTSKDASLIKEDKPDPGKTSTSSSGAETDAVDDIPSNIPPPAKLPVTQASTSGSDRPVESWIPVTADEVRRQAHEEISNKLVSVIGAQTLSFIKSKEDFKRHLRLPAFLYSDCPVLASSIPYFHVSDDYRLANCDGVHLVVCVHGLDGNSADLRLIKTYLELGLPDANLEFLMSERNQGDTFSDFEKMTDKLVQEIVYHIEVYRLHPAKISFIGHSLGTIIIRSALARPEMKRWLNRLHTFLSLSGPHLGTLYNSSGLVNMGLWFIQKWKKSGSLLQLALKDAADIRQTFLYKLSQKQGLEHFRHVLLFGSSQDRYVPIHSARIELCKAALKDSSVQGLAYREMVHNLLDPILHRPQLTFIRYAVHHALPNTANSLIGRAAHIAVLDSELFIEKFMTVCGLKYFR